MQKRILNNYPQVAKVEVSLSEAKAIMFDKSVVRASNIFALMEKLEHEKEFGEMLYKFISQFDSDKYVQIIMDYMKRRYDI